MSLFSSLRSVFMLTYLPKGQGHFVTAIILTIILLTICCIYVVMWHSKFVIVCSFLDFYEKTKKRQAIILNNRDYLLDNIEPNDELIACLVTLNCITKKERQFILRQRSKRKKNVSLLHIMRSFDEAQFLAVVKYLREVNEKTLAKVIESGGGLK